MNLYRNIGIIKIKLKIMNIERISIENFTGRDLWKSRICFGFFWWLVIIIMLISKNWLEKKEENNLEEMRKIRKSELKDKVKLNDIEEDVQAMGSEIRNIVIEGNTILKIWNWFFKRKIYR